jgi:hypothetical protein
MSWKLHQAEHAQSSEQQEKMSSLGASSLTHQVIGSIRRSIKHFWSSQHLTNQLCNFSDKLADMLASIKSILKKGVMFQQIPKHQIPFKKAHKYTCLLLPTMIHKADCRHLAAQRFRFIQKQKQNDNTWQAVQTSSKFLTSSETWYTMTGVSRNSRGMEQMLHVCWLVATQPISSLDRPHTFGCYYKPQVWSGSNDQL